MTMLDRGIGCASCLLLLASTAFAGRAMETSLPQVKATETIVDSEKVPPSIDFPAVRSGTVATNMISIEVFPLDMYATNYGVFNCHNQKVVSTPYGIFGCYVKAATEQGDPDWWRLMKSTDGGAHFSLILEGFDRTHAPVIESDEHGNVFLFRSHWGTQTASQGYRFSPDNGYATPLTFSIPATSKAQKFVALYDRARRHIYYFANNEYSDVHFVTMDLDGAHQVDVPLVQAGPVAALMFPHLSLDTNGDLYAAWTAAKEGRTDYHGIHFMLSKSGGLDWQTLDGVSLSTPVIADEYGPTDRVNLEDEFSSQMTSFLQSILARDGKVHFTYEPDDYTNGGAPMRQHYVRFDVLSATKDVDVYPKWVVDGVVIDNSFYGAFASHRQRDRRPIYSVQVSHDNQLVVLRSLDSGTTWHVIALSPVQPGSVCNLGTARWIGDDGYLVGSFDIGMQVWFFRAKVADAVFDSDVGWANLGPFGGWESGQGDFNGDGKTDLLLHYNDVTSWRSWVATSRGDGTFNAAVHWEKVGPFGGWESGQGDFNGDGKIDLILTANDQESWRSWVATSRGDGTFNSAIAWESPGSFANLAMDFGDLNGDGKTDLILHRNSSVVWQFWAAISNGDGSFASPNEWRFNGNFTGFQHAIADVNGDHRDDVLLCANDSSAWRAFSVLARAGGTFAPSPTSWTYVGDFSGHDPWFGDVDGDGKTDMILQSSDPAGHAGHPTENWRAWVSVSDGVGRFHDPVAWWRLASADDWKRDIGDFDGDHKTDLLLHYNDNTSLRSHVALSTGVTLTGVTVSPGAIRGTMLLQNYPNPFNPTTTISFFIAKPGHVALRIFDVSGQYVVTLFDGNAARGPSTATWNGRDAHGVAVSSGIYFYQLRSSTGTEARKMVLLK